MKRIICCLLIFTSFNGMSKDYYVSIKGNNKNEGLTQDTAWRTIAFAANLVKAGDVVWIKSGYYGNENIIINNNGNKDEPISFIGYKNKPRDITSMYYSYSKDRYMDPYEMPMLDGKNRANGLKAINLNNSKYIIIKNIQIKNYRWGIYGGNSSNTKLVRILAISFGDKFKKISGFAIKFGSGGNNLIKQSILVNATGANLRIEGNRNIIDNVKSYCDDNSTGQISATDYYIHINGGNYNVIKNCYVERIGNLDHTGHGIGLKYNCENNLIENCVIINVKSAIELRHSGVKNNIVRKIIIKGPLGTITFRDGSKNNLVEKITVENTNEGIRFYDQTEDGQGGVVASNNVVQNSIFSNIGIFIVSTKSKKVSKIGYIFNNKVINCTIVDVNNIFKTNLPMDNSNEILNSTFSSINNIESNTSKYKSNWKNINNNYYNNGFTMIIENGNISENPKFEDEPNRNYRLKKGSKLINSGKKISTILEDYDGNLRPQGVNYDIGAFEFRK